MQSLYSPLGRLSWLWMNSPLHRAWRLGDGARFLLPPIELCQYTMLEREHVPVAYCSWAWLNAEAEARYIVAPSELAPADWHSGDRLWLIDWVAPFSTRDSWNLRGAMKTMFRRHVARAIRVKTGSDRARVMEFRGAEVPADNARALLARYYEEFLSRI